MVFTHISLAIIPSLHSPVFLKENVFICYYSWHVCEVSYITESSRRYLTRRLSFITSAYPTVYCLCTKCSVKAKSCLVGKDQVWYMLLLYWCFRVALGLLPIFSCLYLLQRPDQQKSSHSRWNKSHKNIFTNNVVV